MADTFGLLEIPAPAPADGDALTDPALDMVLGFMLAVLNEELGTAWGKRAPTDPKVVAYVFNHAPMLESFKLDETPALYGWRSDDAGSFRYTQDLVADEGGMTFLWVPPALEQETERFAQGIRNGIKKVLKAAFAQGRHPAWVLEGDDYYNPEDYGSVLLYHAKLAKARLGAFRTHPLPIENHDRSYRKTFDTLLFTLDTLEFYSYDAAGKERPLARAQGVVQLGEPGVRLDMLPPEETETYSFDPALTGISPASGTIAGGTEVTISGRQFTAPELLADAALPTVFFGDEQAPDYLVEYVDESTLTVVTPAHAAGAVDVRVVFPSGVEKTLAAAFTFTP